MPLVDPEPGRDVAGYLRGARRCETPAALAAYTVEHLRDIAGAEWSECASTTPRGTVSVLATTDRDLTRELLRARAVAGEPPSPAAVAEQTVTIDDLTVSSPWPSFAAAATDTTPVRSAVLGYFSATQGAGVLTVIDRRPARFGPAERSSVRLVADLFAVLLSLLQTSASVGQLQQGVLSGRVVGAACGMLAVRRGIGTDAAFELLRDTSQRSNRKLRALAEDVLRTGDLP